jgi:hypothetical protein
MIPLLGFKGGVIVPPMWRRMQNCRGGRLREGTSALAAANFANLVSGHGPAVAGGADAKVRAAINAAAAE